MAKTGPEVLLLRHGQTEWSLNGRHTGSTDVPLTEEGRAQARAVHDRLAGREFALVLTSPLGRARETAELAGLGAQAQVREDLFEWDYGDYEGVTTADIRKRDPDWLLWRDGCPGGERKKTSYRDSTADANLGYFGRLRIFLRPQPPKDNRSGETTYRQD